MDNTKYWELYNNNEIKPKIYKGEKKDGTEITVESFVFQNVFYLRIITDFEYLTGARGRYGKRYKMNRHNCFFKEFSNKESANNYFKKIKCESNIERLV